MGVGYLNAIQREYLEEMTKIEHASMQNSKRIIQKKYLVNLVI